MSFLLASPSARAQGYLAPSLGVTFANPSSQGRADFFANLGFVSPTDPLGAELDVMYAPSFFGNQGPLGQNHVTTVMGNVLFAAGSGGGGRGRYGFARRGGSSAVRPYVSAGVGVIHAVVTDDAGRGISNTDLGVNAGVGVMAFSRRSIGLRADLRYFRDLMDNQSGNTTNIDFGSFHFWRAGIGLLISF
ncbi:MAG TPA: outer membrane beta-barrel protein [Vicinamibacterales bacterium]|nr:outer membrane beta-barrel protein [Vicinamibacterales bacterium]